MTPIPTVLVIQLASRWMANKINQTIKETNKQVSPVRTYLPSDFRICNSCCFHILCAFIYRLWKCVYIFFGNLVDLPTYQSGDFSEFFSSHSLHYYAQTCSLFFCLPFPPLWFSLKSSCMHI